MRWFVLAIVLTACGGDDTGPTSSTKIRDGAATDAGKTTPSSDAGSSSSGSTTAPDAGAPTGDDDTPPPEEHEGEATYFAAGTLGACGTKTPADKLVGALGPSLYSKDVCGQCAEVTGPKGTVTVVINDRCAGCKGASMDLSTQAFTQIATKSQGRVKITWHYVDCP